MSYKVREFNLDTDYNTVSEWWRKQDWTPVAPGALSTTGYIVDDKCAGWLYIANSYMGFVEWVVGNPDCDKIERREALKELLNHINNVAKINNCKVLLTTTPNSGLIERCQEVGWTETDQNISALIKEVQ